MYILQSLRSREKLNLKLLVYKTKTAFVVFGKHISVQKKAHWYCRKQWLDKEQNVPELVSPYPLETWLWCQSESAKLFSAGFLTRHGNTERHHTSGRFGAKLLQIAMRYLYMNFKINPKIMSSKTGSFKTYCFTKMKAFFFPSE